MYACGFCVLHQLLVHTYNVPLSCFIICCYYFTLLPSSVMPYPLPLSIPLSNLSSPLPLSISSLSSLPPSLSLSLSPSMCPYPSGKPVSPIGLSIAEPASSDSVKITWSVYTSLERRVADNFVVELSDDGGSTYIEVHSCLVNLFVLHFNNFCSSHGQNIHAACFKQPV